MRTKVIITILILSTVYLFISYSEKWVLFLIGLIIAFALFGYVFFGSKLRMPEVAKQSADDFFEKSPILMIEVDESWQILRVNPAVTSLLSDCYCYELEHVNLFSLFSPANKKRLKRSFGRIKQQAIHQLLCELQSPSSGQCFSVSIDAKFDSKKRLIMVYLTNLNSIKKIEDQLIAKNNVLQGIINNSLSAVILTNETGAVIEWNPVAQILIKINKNNALNKPIQKILCLDQNKIDWLDKLGSNFIPQLVGNKKRFYLLNRLNESIPVEVSAFEIQGENGKIYCYFLQDISKELASYEQELLLASIVRQTSDAIILLNNNLQITTWNQAATLLFSRSKSEVMGKSIFAVIDNNHYEKFKSNLTVCLTRKDTIRFEFCHAVEQQKNKYFLVNVNKLVFSANQQGLCLLITDISKLKENELLIKQLANKLQQSNQELEAFSYAASHDLKTPLRGIKSYALMVREDFEDVLNKAGQKQLSAIINSADHLELLLDSLLDYSMVNNLQLDLKLVDTNKVVNQVVSSIKHWLIEKNACVDIQQAIPSVLSDELRLSEIFTNLITNGVKYNDNAEPVITIGVDKNRTNQQHLCLFTSDNGIGIASKHHQSVFGIFERLHKLNQYDGGAGAGLTITKRTIERMHGEIWLESEVGKGTTFYLILPRSSVALLC